MIQSKSTPVVNPPSLICFLFLSERSAQNKLPPGLKMRLCLFPFQKLKPSGLAVQSFFSPDDGALASLTWRQHVLVQEIQGRLHSNRLPLLNRRASLLLLSKTTQDCPLEKGAAGIRLSAFYGCIINVCIKLSRKSLNQIPKRPFVMGPVVSRHNRRSG